MSMSPAEFAAHRQLTGLTYADLADRLGVNPRTVRAWESGRDRVPERILYEMRDLVAENARLGQKMAASGVVVVIPRDGWHIQAAARAILLEPDTMIEWMP